MNQWANDQNRNQDWNPAPPNQPPRIEVRDSVIYCNGWPAGNLVPAESTNPDTFNQVQAALENHFKNQNRGILQPARAPEPQAVPDIPDDRVVNLLPHDDNDHDIETALDFALDFTFPDTAQRRWERCQYLNRLLSRKLDLDFDVAWKQFKVKGATFPFPPSSDYKDAVYERLQKACSDYYDRYCLEAEYLVPNEKEPIESNIEIDWSTTIFHKKGFDWWFDLRTRV